MSSGGNHIEETDLSKKDIHQARDNFLVKEEKSCQGSIKSILPPKDYDGLTHNSSEQRPEKQIISKVKVTR